MALGFTASAFQTSVKGLGALMGLLASSIIVIIALIDWVGGGLFRGESIYAMVVACITVLLVLVHIYKEKKEGDGDGGGMVMFGVLLAFFAALWLVMACLVTFRGPFIATGNGYFASVSVPFCMSIYIYNLNDRKFDSAYGTKDRLHLLAQVDLHVLFRELILISRPPFFWTHSGLELLVHALPATLQSATPSRVADSTIHYSLQGEIM